MRVTYSFRPTSWPYRNEMGECDSGGRVPLPARPSLRHGLRHPARIVVLAQGVLLLRKRNRTTPAAHRVALTCIHPTYASGTLRRRDGNPSKAGQLDVAGTKG